MDQPKSATPHQLNSSEVVFRFALRLALLSMFATFGAQGFAKTFAALLALSVIFCVVMHNAAGSAVRSDADPLG
jgi:hypothetical protein